MPADAIKERAVSDTVHHTTFVHPDKSTGSYAGDALKYGLIGSLLSGVVGAGAGTLRNNLSGGDLSHGDAALGGASDAAIFGGTVGTLGGLISRKLKRDEENEPGKGVERARKINVGENTLIGGLAGSTIGSLLFMLQNKNKKMSPTEIAQYLGGGAVAGAGLGFLTSPHHDENHDFYRMHVKEAKLIDPATIPTIKVDTDEIERKIYGDIDMSLVPSKDPLPEDAVGPASRKGGLAMYTDFSDFMESINPGHKASVRRAKAMSQLSKDLDKSASILTKSQLLGARKDINKDPTEAQVEAGNYKKGRLAVQGMQITLENAKGQTRSGTDDTGNEWSIKMKNDYGYFPGTTGKDGDEVDVFLGSELDCKYVYVVDQSFNGKFDEHKVMLGFPNVTTAKKAYLANYEKGWKGLGNITRCSVDKFKLWLSDSKRKNKTFKQTYKAMDDTLKKFAARKIEEKVEKPDIDIDEFIDQGTGLVDYSQLGTHSSGQRAGKAQELATAMGEQAGFSTRYPLTANLLSMVAGGAGGALLGGVIGGGAGRSIGGFGGEDAAAITSSAGGHLGATVGGGIGALLGTLINTSYRRGDIKDIKNKFRRYKGDVEIRKPEESSWLSVLSGGHDSGRAKAVEALRGDTPKSEEGSNEGSGMGFLDTLGVIFPGTGILTHGLSKIHGKGKLRRVGKSF